MVFFMIGMQDVLMFSDQKHFTIFEVVTAVKRIQKENALDNRLVKTQPKHVAKEFKN